MKQLKWKEMGIDLLVDIAAGMLIAIGVYNFALNANFPVAGFSGIAIIIYHLWKIPVGIGTILLSNYVPHLPLIWRVRSPANNHCSSHVSFETSYS